MNPLNLLQLQDKTIARDVFVINPLNLQDKEFPNKKLKLFGLWFYSELIHLIGNNKSIINVNGIGYYINTNSTRLQCFKRDARCAHCDLIGSIWALQSVEDERPHLNLYAKDRDNKFVLMTQDHIIPKSHGGSSLINNLWTMCYSCNQAKGNDLEKI